MNNNSPEKIFLNRNEYFFAHPPEVIRALTSPYEENFISHYAKHGELNSLKEAISKLYNVDKNLLLLGHGAEDIFVKILSWFRKEINSVVIEDFSWTNYLHIAEGFDYQVHTVSTTQTQDSFSFNKVDFYNKLFSLKSAIIFLTSPNNPTGHAVNLNDFYELASTFPNHIFILDSVYNEIEDTNYTRLFNLKNLIFIGSFSKFFGMPGLRLGYAIGNLPKAFQLNLGLQPSTIYAAHAALNNKNYYKNNRMFMLNFTQLLIKKNYSHVKIYKSLAPFFLAKINSNFKKFKEAEDLVGIVPKYIERNKESYIRFGLGPQNICDKITLYLENLT